MNITRNPEVEKLMNKAIQRQRNRIQFAKRAGERV